jgi:hypothetical protein
VQRLKQPAPTVRVASTLNLRQALALPVLLALAAAAVAQAHVPHVRLVRRALQGKLVAALATRASIPMVPRVLNALRERVVAVAPQARA